VYRNSLFCDIFCHCAYYVWNLVCKDYEECLVSEIDVCRKSADRQLNYVSRSWEYTLEGNKEHKMAQQCHNDTAVAIRMCTLIRCINSYQLSFVGYREETLYVCSWQAVLYTYAYKYVLSIFSWVCRNSHVIPRHLLTVIGLYFIHVTFSQLAADDGVSLAFLGSVSSRRYSGDYHTRFLVLILIVINNLE